MKLGGQIKKIRTDAKLSQEEMADKVYVSRQTISNWETDKSYPDVKSLLLISEVFQISLDVLIKGDLENMKREIDLQEYTVFQRDSLVFSVLLIALIALPVPLIMFCGRFGIIIFLLLFGVGIYYASRVEKYKKKYDIQTYKEIVAFTEGKSLNQIEKAREEGKRPYQKTLMAIGAGMLAMIAGVLIMALLKAVLS